MARIFITGSADGLGALAAKELIGAGHEALLHARSEERGREALEKVPRAIGVVTGDLGSSDGVKSVASQANEGGPFDAVIHNAAVYHNPGEEIVQVNIVAPYMLTCLIERPRRLIYMSSGMHGGGNVNFGDLVSNQGAVSYSDSKLYVLMLAKALARRWPDVYSNAVDPGWVPTKMGGSGAPDSFADGIATQVWLASSDEDAVKVSGKYFHHKRQPPHNPQADDEAAQDRLIEILEEMTGATLPH